VVTGVTEEDRNLMKKLGSNEIKDALKLAKNITVTAITEEEIQSRLKRTDKRVTDPENGLPIEFLRADAVYGILREKYPLKDGELAAIVSDAVSEAEADALLKLFEDVLPKKVSFCVAVAPEKGEAAFSLSSFIAKWLAEIEEGHNASAIKLPAIKMPADIIEDLEKSLVFALYLLASA